MSVVQVCYACSQGDCDRCEPQTPRRDNGLLMGAAFNEVSRNFDELLQVIDKYRRFVKEDKAEIQALRETLSAYVDRAEKLESACQLLLKTSGLPQSQQDAILDFIENVE